MNQVFISHSTKDDSFVNKLVNELHNNNIHTFVDHNNIKIGDNWANSISDALDTCSQMLVIISPDSCDSKMCLKEWIHFTDKNKEIIPVKYRPTDDFPFLFVDLQWVDMESPDNYDKNIHKLVEFLGDNIILRPKDNSNVITQAQSLPEANDTLPAQLFSRYQLTRQNGKFIGIATGNIAEIKGVDVLVNSENDRLRMARPEEKSVSAAINAFSMIYDEFHNTEECPVEDALDKYRKTATKARFPPASVIETISGNLGNNGIRHIIHAVSVKAAGNKGNFIPFSRLLLGRCVTNVLKKIDDLNNSLYADKNQVPLTRVVFPILGTGDAGGDIGVIAPRLLDSAIEYLETNDTKITEVYFVAFTQTHLDKLQSIFNDYTNKEYNNQDLVNYEQITILK